MKKLLFLLSTASIVGCSGYTITNQSGEDIKVGEQTIEAGKCEWFGTYLFFGDFPLKLTDSNGDSLDALGDDKDKEWPADNYTWDGVAFNTTDRNEKCDETEPEAKPAGAPTAGESEESAAPAGGGGGTPAAGDTSAGTPTAAGGSYPPEWWADKAQNIALRLETIVTAKRAEIVQLEENYRLVSGILPPNRRQDRQEEMFQAETELTRLQRLQEEVAVLADAVRSDDKLNRNRLLQIETELENLRRSIDQ